MQRTHLQSWSALLRFMYCLTVCVTRGPESGDRVQLLADRETGRLELLNRRCKKAIFFGLKDLRTANMKRLDRHVSNEKGCNRASIPENTH